MKVVSEENDLSRWEVFNYLNSNFALHEIILDEHQTPVDYRFLAVNSAMEKATGFTAAQMVGKTALELFPNTELYWIEKFAQVALTGIAAQYENYSSELNRYYEMKLFSPCKGQFAMLATDITEQVLDREKLKEIKDHFELLFNLNPDAVTITQLSDGLFVDINKGYTDLLGYTRDEVIGQTTLFKKLWVDPYQRQVFREIIQRDGYCNNFESSFRCKDGHIVTGMVSSVMFNYQEKPHLLSVTRDITARKNAEMALRENERMLKESQKIAGLGSYKLNFKTEQWSCSEVLGAIFGIDANYTRSISSWINIIHPNFREEMHNYLQHNIIQSKQKFDKEYKIIRQSDQQERWVHGLGELIFNSRKELRYMVGTVQDISDRKKAELTIQQQNKVLTDLNNTQNKLFSIIAHDLRNPFNILLNFSEMLMHSSDEFNQEDIVLLASQMNIVSKQTYNLLENLLEWFRLQTGHLKPNPVQSNLRSILLEVLQLANELAAKKEIIIVNHIKPHIMVLCDKEMTKTILRNLITNAIKFTNHHGQIILDATTNGTNVNITVTDTGVGIAPEILPQLFSFETNATTFGTENEVGSGIGLHLCKELIEKQEGKIWVESQVNKGSCFGFSLPLFLF